MHTNVAVITKHHFVRFLRIRWSANITNNILIIFDAQTLLTLHDCLYFVPAASLNIKKATFTQIPKHPSCSHKKKKNIPPAPPRRAQTAPQSREIGHTGPSHHSSAWATPHRTDPSHKNTQHQPLPVHLIGNEDQTKNSHPSLSGCICSWVWKMTERRSAIRLSTTHTFCLRLNRRHWKNIYTIKCVDYIICRVCTIFRVATQIYTSLKIVCIFCALLLLAFSLSSSQPKIISLAK